MKFLRRLSIAVKILFSNRIIAFAASKDGKRTSYYHDCYVYDLHVISRALDKEYGEKFSEIAEGQANVEAAKKIINQQRSD